MNPHFGSRPGDDEAVATTPKEILRAPGEIGTGGLGGLGCNGVNGVVQRWIKGTGGVICPTCGGPKRMKNSAECKKCHLTKYRAMQHRMVMTGRRKRGLEGKPIPCPECGANVTVPPRGEIICPRCKWSIV